MAMLPHSKPRDGLPVTSRLKAAEKPQQVSQLIIGHYLTVRMAVGDKHILELCGPTVVEERVALTNAAQRRGIKLGHSVFIAQADVVGGVRRIAQRRNMAVMANCNSASLEAIRCVSTSSSVLYPFLASRL